MRIALLILSVPAICLAQAPGRPHLVIEAPIYDFGKVAPDAQVSHRFKLRNAGDASLTIGKLSPSCGCTSTMVGKETLAPGDDTELEVTFNTTGLKGMARKSVQVASDDPAAPLQTLSFQAEVLPDITTSTDQVWFGDLAPKDCRKASVKLESTNNRPIILDDVVLSKAPWLGVATREENSTLWVDFELHADRLPPGALSGSDSVTLKIRSPRPSVIQLNAVWERHLPVKVTPPRVVWSETAGQELSTYVVLKNWQDQPFRILSVRTSSPLVRVIGIQPRAASSKGFRVELDRSAPPGNYSETVFLTLDTPGHPELEIRVAAALR